MSIGVVASSEVITVSPAGVRGVRKSFGTGGSAVVAFPAGTVAGDLVVVLAASLDGPSGMPSGWFVKFNSGALTFINGAAIYKVVDSSEATTGSVTIPLLTTTNFSAYALAFSKHPGFAEMIYAVRGPNVAGTVTSPAYDLTTADRAYYFGSDRSGTVTMDRLATSTLVDSDPTSALTSFLRTESGLAPGAVANFTAVGGSGYMHYVFRVPGELATIKYNNPTPSTLVTLVSAGSATETLIADMDTGATLNAGAAARVNLCFYEAMSAVGFTKACIFRVRDGGPTGTIVASQSLGDAGVDSTSGLQIGWERTLDLTLATNRLCATIQTNNGNTPQITSARRVFTVSQPI